jgi:hypothetical protein
MIKHSLIGISAHVYKMSAKLLAYQGFVSVLFCCFYFNEFYLNYFNIFILIIVIYLNIFLIL